jgi:tRNA modification GTPase
LLIVNNKTDTISTKLDVNSQVLNISAKTGDGLDQLKARILEMAGWQSGLNEGVFTARTRHLDALEAVLSHVQQAKQFMQFDVVPLDLMAEECRLAQNHLSLLTGTFSADDLLGEIFSRFCIGK